MMFNDCFFTVIWGQSVSGAEMSQLSVLLPVTGTLYSVRFCSIVFDSVLLCSILVCSGLFWSVLFCSGLFWSVLVCSAFEGPALWFADSLLCFSLFLCRPFLPDLLSVWLRVQWSVLNVTCLPVCLSVCLSVCLPVCLSVCLSVCLPVDDDGDDGKVVYSRVGVKVLRNAL